MPPPLVGIWDHSTFTNSATARSWFGQFCILPWVRKLEAEFQRVVFADPTGDFHLELDMSGLMRGDYSQQWAAYKIALYSGVLTPNEVREAAGYNPRPDGNELRPVAQPAQGDSGTPA